MHAALCTLSNLCFTVVCLRGDKIVDAWDIIALIAAEYIQNFIFGFSPRVFPTALLTAKWPFLAYGTFFLFVHYLPFT